MNIYYRQLDLHKAGMVMRKAVSEIRALISTTRSLPFMDGSTKTVHYIEIALQIQHVSKSAGRAASNFLGLLETDTTRTFVSLLQDVAGQLCLRCLQYI